MGSAHTVEGHVAVVTAINNSRITIIEAHWGGDRIIKRTGTADELRIKGYFDPDLTTATKDGKISNAVREGIYSFVATNTGSYRIASTGNLDTYGYLYSSSMVKIGENDDGAGLRQFMITANLTAGQRYIIKVKAYNKNDTGAYGLRVSGPAPAVKIVATVPTLSYFWYPDLYPTYILFNFLDLAVGKQIILDSGISNTGNTFSNAFNVKWFVDGVQVDYEKHGSVPARSTVLDGNSAYCWTPPSEGTYVITFVVDADNQIREFYENNNEISITVYVPPTSESAPPLPDLVPTDILYNVFDLAVGRQITIDSGIRNDGIGFSNVFNIKWFINDEVLVGYGGHYPIPGYTTVLDGNSAYCWTPPSYGTYVITFVVDADNNVAESNEENNMISVTINIQPSGMEYAHINNKEL